MTTYDDTDLSLSTLFPFFLTQYDDIIIDDIMTFHDLHMADDLSDDWISDEAW